MTYQLSEVVNIVNVYSNMSCASGSFQLNNAFFRDKLPDSAKRVIEALEEYRKLPEEVRVELNRNMKDLNELELLANEVIARGVK